MAIQTSTGVRLSISSGLPASYDLAGYGALNYVEIGEITNIPQFGAAFQTVTNSPLASGIVQKRKGFVDYGNPVIDMALDNGNSGQQMMRAACDGIRKNQAHAFKLTYGDGELRYWSARVFSFQEAPGSANNIVGATSTMGITRAVLQIPRITLDLAFSDDVYSLNGEVKNFSDIITFNRSTTGTYINQSGVLTTAAIDEPRLSYDPATGESLGLLIEGSSTNLLTYSEQFDNAAWNKTDATITANSATAPDGANTMDMLVEGSALGVHSVTKSAVPPPSSTITLTVYAKSSTRKKLYLSFGGSIMNDTGGSGADLSNVFNLETGEVDVSGYTATMQKVGGSYRCSITAITGGSGSFAVEMATADNSGSAVYQGDGTSGIYIWGAQLEQKPYTTSYIKTEASQVTRAADLASVDDLSAWYNQSEGAIYCEMSRGDQFYSASNVYALGDNDANKSELYIVAPDGVSLYNTINGAVSNESVGNFLFASSNKAVCNMRNSGCSVALNGSYSGGLGAYTASGDISRLGIGVNSAMMNHFGGHIKTLSYFPSALSQSEMELITL